LLTGVTTGGAVSSGGWAFGTGESFGSTSGSPTCEPGFFALCSMMGLVLSF
jgi:hypothetical protein